MKVKAGLGSVLQQCQTSALWMISSSGRHQLIITGMKMKRNELSEYKNIVCKSSLLYLEQLCITVKPSMGFPPIHLFSPVFIGVYSDRMRIM